MSEFLCNVDINKVNQLLEETDTNVKYFEEISDSVANAYSNQLDTIMKNIYTDIVSVDNAPINVLEKYFMELSNVLYFMGEKLEHLGVYEDMSKAQMKQVYNDAYLRNQEINSQGKSKTTVAENQAVAEGASIYETAVTNIYSRSYKIFKYKIDQAQIMLNSISKIISRRMSESQLSIQTIGNKQLLNEGYNADY